MSIGFYTPENVAPPKVKIAGSRKFAALWKAADAAGKAAAKAKVPAAMVVTEECGPNRGRQDYIADGVCGFAWVEIPNRGNFAKWLVQEGKGRVRSYSPGVHIWVSDYRQSMELKGAYAGAFAAVLREGGIKAHADWRMD